MRQPEPSDLGRVLSRHNGSVLAGGWLLYFGLILAGGAATSAAAGKWPETTVASCIAVPLLFVCWRRWNQSATVYEGGIVWRRGRRTKVVRWEEVADVEAETFDGDFSLTVTTHDGRELVLDDSLADVKQLHGYLTNVLRGQDRGAPPSSTSSSPRW
ncbi:MAG TPA: hypothetical protein VH913_05100 [Hyphomicrobiaceae bacterium]